MAEAVYRQFQRMTAQEQSYLRSNPHHSFAIREATDAAYKETKRRFGRNGHNDMSDAFVIVTGLRCWPASLGLRMH